MDTMEHDQKQGTSRESRFLYPRPEGGEYIVISPPRRGGIYRISESAWCFLAVDTAFWLFCSISPAPVGI